MSIVGGGCFIVTVVVGLITIVNRSAGHSVIQVGVVNFNRDVITYLVSIFLMWAILYDQYVQLWEALSVLAYYGW